MTKKWKNGRPYNHSYDWHKERLELLRLSDMGYGRKTIASLYGVEEQAIAWAYRTLGIKTRRMQGYTPPTSNQQAELDQYIREVNEGESVPTYMRTNKGTHSPNPELYTAAPPPGMNRPFLPWQNISPSTQWAAHAVAIQKHSVLDDAIRKAVAAALPNELKAYVLKLEEDGIITINNREAFNKL